MARDTIAVTATIRSGVIAAAAAPVAANNGEFANGGRTVVVLANGVGGAGNATIQVTIQQVADPYGRTENDAGFDVDADEIGVFGPFPPNLYNQTDGTVQIDYDIDSTNAEIFALAVVGA